MKKFIFTFMIMMSAVFSAFAQQTTVEGSRFFDNTSVSLYGGASSWLQPSVGNADNFMKGIRPVVGVGFNKWATPVLGFNLFYENTIDNLPYNTAVERSSAFDMMNLGLNVQLNLNNWIHKYKGRPDLCEVVPYVGLGWVHGWTDKQGDNMSGGVITYDATTNYMSSNLGANVNFNLGKHNAWQVFVRPGISYMIAGEGLPVRYNWERANVNCVAGVTYKFGHKNSTGVRVHDFTSAYTVAQMNSVLAEVNSLKAKLAEAPDTVVKEVPVEVIKEVPVEVVKNTVAIPAPHFVRDGYVLDATSESALIEIAKQMHKNQDVYTVTGYASEEGTDEYNKELSLRRANAVVNFLNQRGVDLSRLKAVAGGETKKFGDTYDANRVVVVEKK